MIRLPCSIPTPAGLLASDHCDVAAWPLVCKKQRLPRKVFRSSIAWLSDWLSTLRGVSYLRTTQDSLPVAGQALLDGVLTRKVPMKGFKVVLYISSPFPKLCSAQMHRPPAIWPVAQLHFSPQIGLIWAHLCSLLGLRHRNNSGGRPCRRPFQRLSADGAGQGKRTSTARESSSCPSAWKKLRKST